MHADDILLNTDYHILLNTRYIQMNKDKKSWRKSWTKANAFHVNDDGDDDD